MVRGHKRVSNADTDAIACNPCGRIWMIGGKLTEELADAAAAGMV